MNKEDAVIVQETINKTKKSGKISLIVATVLLILTIIAGLFVLYKAGIFMSAPDRVTYALKNTFLQETPLTELLKLEAILDDEFTVDVRSNLKDAGMDAKFLRTKGQIQLNGQLEYKGLSLTMDTAIDDSSLRMYAPEYMSQTLRYNYKSTDNKGVLLKLFDDASIEKYNTNLEKFYKNSQYIGGVSELTKYYPLINLWWKQNRFEKTPDRYFTVNGSTQPCKGYSITYTKSQLQEALAIIEKQLMTDGSDEELAVANTFEKVREFIAEQGNIKITFYIFDNKYISGIVLKSEAAEYELIVMGGNKPWANAKITRDGADILGITGGIDGEKEAYIIYKDASPKYKIVYDSSSDTLSVETDKEFAYTATCEKSADMLQITLTDVMINGVNHEGNAVLTVSKGADLKKLSSEELDIGKANVYDLLGLFQIFRKLQPADKTTGDDGSITLCMVGDILTHEKVQNSAKKSDGTYDYTAIFAETKDFISSRDVAIVNQEVILGGTELGITGYPTFNSPYELADYLADTGFDIICHATNHALDRGSKGLLNCMNNWTRFPEVEVLGIHDSQQDQDAISILDIKGHKIAFLNYTYGTNGIPLPSGMPYAVDLLDEKKVIADIKEAEQKAEFTVVMPHWGSEYLLSTDASQKKWTDIFLKNGVDLVIGTHPHVIEPVEMLKDDAGHQMLVYYSLGNYVNWSASTGAGVCNRMVGGIADVTLATADKGIYIADYSFVPIVTDLQYGDGGVKVYFLKDYTEAQAKNNKVRNSDSTFSLDYAIKLVKDVAGEKWVAW